MIQLKGVGVQRSGRWILRDINWEIPAGACVAILGPNGSGKSTLTRILAGHLWPTAGDVRVLDGHFGESSLPELRKRIRLVQAAGPYDVDAELTCLEVVLTGFFSTIGLYEVVTPSMREKAEGMLRHVGLSHVADHVYATLSSGERVRALIARALVVRPRLLLLDEPTAGLDLLAREQVLATVQRMFEAGAGQPPPTTVMITHHVEELPPATSQILVLSDGRPAMLGSPEQVIRPEVLSAVYRCPVQVRRSGERWYLEVHPDAWEGLLNR
ncbi:ATP-binding cassette domain-containing protein [Humisphaera borealis]|uniref:ATP-binding cassette domain-containing protein n=1 Tax=Humisphaera borealis TaxID=2807512 RepID=A0A7M2X5V6_9BACT|nr:ATP-binding cassette domain-containing protein [Humisphaera borealis]